MFKTYKLPILAGFFIGTSYIPFPPWASLFGFVPLWLFWLEQTSFKRVFLGGIVTSFVFTVIGFNWMTYLLHEFAHVDWWLAIIGMIFYALGAHLYVPIAGILWFWTQKKVSVSPKLSLILLALITALCERYSLTLFDWNFGYSWYGTDLPLYQWAEFVGFSGLSSITVLCNLPMLIGWQSRKIQRGKNIFHAAFALFIALNIGGVFLKTRLEKPDSSVNTLFVQGNIGNSDKIAAETGKGYGRIILNRYLELTKNALETNPTQKVDFIIWPETAFPAFLGEGLMELTPYPYVLKDFLKTRQLPLITGSYSADKNRELLTNSLFLLNEQGDIVEPHYSKSILLAFGEYIPFEEYFPQIRQWLPPIGHFQRGQGATDLFRWKDYKIAPQICYEGLFPWLARDFANLDAQFIVNVTNDSWYGSWQEPYQHFYMTMARAIEFRRPVLRVTNTGISSVALASGEILQRSPIQREWTGFYQIPYSKNPQATFYQNWFYLIPTLLWTALITILWISLKNKTR